MNETTRRNLSALRPGDAEAMQEAISGMNFLSTKTEPAAARPVPTRKSVTPTVYFIRFGDDGPIKIGYARDTWLRFHNLQCGSPVELTYLGGIRGDRTLEHTLHERFHEHRIRGEWFEPVPELLDYIAEVLSPAA